MASSKGIYILYCKQQIKLKEQKTGSQNSPPLIPNKINIFKKTKANTDIHQKPLNQEKAPVSFEKLQKVLDKERNPRFQPTGTCCQTQCPVSSWCPLSWRRALLEQMQKKQHASNFLLAEKNPLSIILRPKWKGSKSRRLEKESEHRCPQCRSSSSPAEVGTVIPYPEHLPDAVKRSGPY